MTTHGIGPEPAARGRRGSGTPDVASGGPVVPESGGAPRRDVPWRMDPASRRLHWTDPAAAAATFRRDAAAVHGTLDWWEACIHAADRERVTQGLASAMAGRADTWSDEYRFLRGDGTYGWFFDRAFITRAAGGAAVALTGAMMDLTERRATETALREATERYRTFVDLSPDGIWRMEFAAPVRVDGGPGTPSARLVAHGYVAECNAAFAAMMGADRPDELIGARLDELAARQPVPDAGLLDLFFRNGCRVVDLPLDAADGRHFLVSAVGTVTDGLLRRVWGTLRDVTRTREMESRLAGVQRVEAVGRLAGGVAHDFNNILTVIKGCAEMLLADVRPDHPHYEDVQEIARAADRASGLIRELLAFSGRLVVQPEVVDLGGIVRDMESMLRRLIPENVQVRVHAPDASTPVHVDAGQIAQVIVDLAVNAAERMPGGGRLDLSVAPAEGAAEHPGGLPPYVTPGRYHTLRVANTGPRMEEATLARLFDPFFTTRGAGPGTGLGLSTVYGITRQSGGYVWAESPPGGGTVFTVLLADAETRPGRASAPDASEPSPRGTVLVVEDEPAVRSLATRILTRAGFTVLTAETPEHALRLAAAEPGGVDLLLTDVVMPGLSGPALARRLAEIQPGVRVLFMSGYAPEAVERHGALDAGAQLLPKPFSGPDLVEAVRQAVGPGTATGSHRLD